MPSPLASKIETDLTNALITAGFKKQAWVDGVVVISEELPDVLKKLVKSYSQGSAQTWAQWMAAQAVTIPVTSVPGTPSIGKIAP